MKQLIVGAALLALAGGASAAEWKVNDRGDLAMATSEDGDPVTMAMIVVNSKQGILGPSLSMKQRDACKIVSLEKGQSGTYKYMMVVDSAVVISMRASCIDDGSVMFDAEDVQAKRFLYGRILSNEKITIANQEFYASLRFSNENGKESMMKVLGTENPNF